MKKLICYFLIVWMALFAGGANAHGISDLAHGSEHAGHAHNASGDLSFEVSVDLAADRVNADQTGADIDKACSQSHCGHGHSTGLLMQPATSIKMDAAADVPLSSSRWASAAITDNIERPKWQVTTPAVVSLLS